MAMFVPIQQRQASPELVKLPLIKFSYVTTTSLHGPLPWTHLPQGSDLSVVFETVTSPTNDGNIQRRVLFKVTVGDHALEQVSLDELAMQATEDERRATQIVLHDTERQIMILTRQPIIALRYKLRNGQTRRIQMNYLQGNGYNKALEIFRSFRLPVKDKPVSSQEEHHSFRPPTASTSTTYRTDGTVGTYDTARTIYSAASGNNSARSDPLHHQQRFSDPTSNFPYPSHGRIFPSASSTMSIVPGPSIPESIVTRARLWPDAVTSDFQNDAVNSRYGDRQLFSTHNPPISQHPPISHNPGDRNYVCQSQPLSDLRPGSSNPGYFMEPLNDMPPPKRKLPFAEHSAQKKAKVTTNSDKPVSKKKNTAKSNVTSSKKEAVEIPKQDEPKTYDLRVRESENLPERLPIGSNPKKSLNSAVASSGQLPSVPRHPGKVLAASPNQPAKTAAKTTVPTQKSEDIQEGSSKVRSQTKKPAKKPSQTKLKTDLPIKKSSKGEPSKKEASKKGPHKRTVPQNKTSTKQAPRARIFACASTATQTESTKEYDCSTYASKATQTQMATMRLKNLHISAATQTDKPLPLQLTPRSRPVLGPLSPNMVAALGDTPSQRRSNRVQPVKKFGTGRRYVNKFNRDPILAVKRV